MGLLRLHTEIQLELCAIAGESVGRFVVQLFSFIFHKYMLRSRLARDVNSQGLDRVSSLPVATHARNRTDSGEDDFTQGAIKASCGLDRDGLRAGRTQGFSCGQVSHGFKVFTPSALTSSVLRVTSIN